MRNFIYLILFISNVANSEPISIKPAQENFSENVSVSGEVRSGMVYKQKNALSKLNIPPVVFVDIGSEPIAPENLCVKLISADGVYELTSSAESASLAAGVTFSGIQDFAFETDYQKELESKEYISEDIAILAYHGYKKCKAIKKILPASWENNASDEITVFLNSGNFDTRLKFRNSKTKEKEIIKCNLIQSKHHVAFDTSCEFNKKHLIEFDKIVILRRNGSNYAKPVKLPISLYSN